jgi:hypothetical protein
LVGRNEKFYLEMAAIGKEISEQNSVRQIMQEAYQHLLLLLGSGFCISTVSSDWILNLQMALPHPPVSGHKEKRNVFNRLIQERATVIDDLLEIREFEDRFTIKKKNE